MATFPAVNRYADLVRGIISGDFYASDGIVLPYRSGLTTLRLETGSASTEYGIYINEIFSGTEVSDTNGNVVLNRQLPIGEIEITMVNQTNARGISTFVTVRNYAVYLAAYAEALETIDDNIIQTRNNLSVATAELEALQEVYGEAISTYADAGQGIEAYRNQVHELRLAYRNFGTRYKGFEEAIASFTQVPPFGYSRRNWGPNWVLDQSMLINHRFKQRSAELTNTTTNITGLTLVDVEPDVVSNPGTAHQIAYTASTNTLAWIPDNSTGPSIAANDGALFLPGPASTTPAHILGRDVSGTPYTITAGGSPDNDYLYFNIDKKGIVGIQLTTGLPNPTPANIVTDLNHASTGIQGDTRYGATYATVASVYNSKLLIASPSAVGSSVEILAGTDNGAGEVFGIKPGDIKFPLGDICAGVEIVNFGGTIPHMGASNLNHLYDDTLTPPHRLRWLSPGGSYGSYVNISETGNYTITDSIGAEIVVHCWLDQMDTQVGTPLITTDTFSIEFNRLSENLPSTQGLWVNIDKDSLPSTDQTDTITVYDDVTDSYVETPDYWFLNPALTATSTTTFYPSSIVTGKNEALDPAPAYKWRLADTSATASIAIYSHALKFPLINNTPRGGNYPQQDPGMFYDYEGYEAKFSGWFKSLGAGATTATLAFSFDGGDNWASGSVTPLVTDTGASDYEDLTYVELNEVIPTDIKYRDSLTYEDSGVLVRVTFAKAGGSIDVIADALNIEVKYISSRSLTNATVSRSRHRQYFGELAWIWAPEALSLTEQKYLGLQYKEADKTTPYAGATITHISTDTPTGNGALEYEYDSTLNTKKLRWVPYGTTYGVGSGWVSIIGDGSYSLAAPDSSTITVNITYSILPVLTGTMPASTSKTIAISDPSVVQGHARKILPAHSSLDIFDATDYDVSGNPINLFGAITEAGFSVCGLVNTKVNSSDPFKYAYASPEFLSQTDEALTLSIVGPNREATLAYYSDEDQTAAVLYENDVPVSNDLWSFSTANTIQIPNTGFTGGLLDSTATFTIDYDLLYQVTSTILDLGASYQDYMWLADYFLWERFDNVQDEYAAETPLVFNFQNGQAALSKKSTADKTTAQLFVQEATEAREIPKRYWSFLDDKTVQIDIAYLVNGQYYLNHYEKRVYETSRLTTTFEHRSGASSTACLAASWAELDKNSNVAVHQTVPHQFHQIRLSIADARDLRDFKLRSLTLKGLKIHGSSPSVEGLTNIWKVD